MRLVHAQCLALLLLSLVACADPESPPAQGTCTPTGEPIYLASRDDDDDGDGNPLDEDFPTINDEDDDIADHAWVRDDDGVFHLFFQNEGHGAPHAIEHYTTRDLQTLEYQGIALEAAGDWDRHGLWAPHVLRVGTTWFLFYTGVNGITAQSQQRIGVATSPDLRTWTRVTSRLDVQGDGAVYDCRSGWTTWGHGGDYDDQCRDPFVLWDAEKERWLLFATARSTNGYGVVTVASSTDLLTWTNLGFIDATRRVAHGVSAQKTGGEAENPFVIERDGNYTLLFTDWRDPEDDSTTKSPRTIVQYATAPSLNITADGSPFWTYRGATPDPGVNAIEVQRLDQDTWLMSQSISNESSGVVEDHRRQLRLMCMHWNSDGSFTTSPFSCADDDPTAAAPTAPRH